MKTSELIKQRRKELRLTMKEVAEYVGVSEATVSRWETGNIANMGRDKIASLAAILKLSPSVIAGYDDNPNSHSITSNYPNVSQEYVEYPVIGDVGAGFDKFAVQEWTGDKIKIHPDYLKGKKQEDYFVLQVKGDSMYPLYLDGDKLLIRRQNSLDYSGQVAVVIYGDDFGTIKKVEYRKNSIALVPINPQYSPEIIKSNDAETFEILGVPALLVREMEE